MRCLFLACIIASYLAATEEKQESIPLSSPEHAASFISYDEHLIGGIVSPISGQPCLHTTDLIAKGAQDIRIERIFIPLSIPCSFHESNSVDKLELYRYLIRHYRGWKLLPHLKLEVIETIPPIARLSDPFGVTVEFQLTGPGQSRLTPGTLGITNTLHETPSGSFDLRNTRLNRSNGNGMIIVNAPDGTERHYYFRGDKRLHKHGRGYIWHNTYQLETEILPNRKLIRYRYPLGESLVIESCDPKGEHVYASVQINGILARSSTIQITSHTGQAATYSYHLPEDKATIKYKTKGGRTKDNYTLFAPPFLATASTPFYRAETVGYADRFGFNSYRGKETVFNLTLAPVGEPACRRVRSLCFPVGPADAFVPVYTLDYDLVSEGKKSGSTIVTNSDGTKTIYRISPEYLLTAIESLDTTGKLCKKKSYSWKEGRLEGIEVQDGKNILFRKTFQYDGFGNPILETVSNHVDGQFSAFTTRRSWSQDGRNLLLTEQADFGPEIQYTYIPNTNLISTKFTYQDNHVLKREFFDYDSSLNLLRQTLDDGTSPEKNDLSGVTERHSTVYTLRQQQPFLHMPEQIEEFYLEKGVEKLLKAKQISYDTWGNPKEEKIYDAEGNFAYTITKTYNERGDLIDETNPLGQKATYTYTPRGQLETSTNFSNRLHTEIAYDPKGRLKASKEKGDNVNHFTTYSYDQFDNLVQEIDSFGNATEYDYDPIVRKPRETTHPQTQDSSGSAQICKTKSSYNILGHFLSQTDACGHTTIFEPTPYGGPALITYPDGAQHHFRYRSDGKIIYEKDPDGLEIWYEYDIFGRIISKTWGPPNAPLAKEAWTYNTFHLISQTDKEGQLATYSYDGAGRKIQENASGHITTYSYNALNQLAEVHKDALTIAYEKDLLGQILQEKQFCGDQLLYMVSYTYDGDGNRVTTTRYIHDAPSTESFQYDPFKRRIFHQDALGYSTTILYDEGHLNTLGQRVLKTTKTDPQGTQTITVFDARSHKIQLDTFHPEQTLISRTTFAYDPHGDLTQQQEYIFRGPDLTNTQTTRLSRDSRHFLTSETRAFGTLDERTIIYTYTPGGKRQTKTYPDNATLTYTYSPLGYLASVSSSDKSIDHIFETDRLGQVLRAVNRTDNITIERSYDPHGNIIHETFGDLAIEKSYDTLSRLKTLTFPDHSSLSYQYDPCYLRSIERKDSAGQTAYRHSFNAYDLSGRLLSESLIGNSGFLQRSYDPKGRPVAIESAYFSQTAKYDAVNNLIETVHQQKPRFYTYDSLSQLSSETISDQTFSYEYDSLFNRHVKNDKYASFNALNELVTHDDITCNYDLHGNLIYKHNPTEESFFTYDALNQLISATTGTTHVTFTYDPFGRRFSKTVTTPGTLWGEWVDTEYYLYDGEHEIGAFSSDGTPKQLRLLAQRPSKGLASTIAIELNSSPYAAIRDLQNNISVLIDPRKHSLYQTYDYTAFGEPQSASKKPFNPWRYASKRLDPELNLIYFGKRYYDPSLARWLTTDPAGFTDSVNLYQYVFNNPYLYYDPDGEFVFALPFLALSWGATAAVLSAPIWVPAAITTAAIGAGIFVGNEIYKYCRREESLPSGRTVWDLPTINSSSLAKTQSAKKRHTPDQEAISELVKESGKKGVSNADADTLLDWAEEYDFPHRDDRGKPHWDARGGMDHIHIGPKHIPVNN